MAEVESSSSDFVETMIGEVMSPIFAVESFWAFYSEQSDAEGNISYPKFHEMFTRAIMNLLEEQGLLDAPVQTINQAIGQATMSERGEDADVKLKTKLKSRIESLVAPVVTKYLFKVFDTDGNGTMSKSEFVTTFMMFGNNISPSVIVDTIFRVLDANGNGSIEAIELAEFLGGIVNALASLIEAIFEDSVDAIVGPFKKHLSMFFMFLSGGEASINMAATAKKVADELVAEMAGTLEGELSTPADVIKQAFAFVQTAPADHPVTAQFWEAFNQKAAGSNTISKDDAIRIAIDTFGRFFTSQIDADAAKQLFQQFAPEPMQEAPIDLEDVFAITTASGRSFLKGGGLKRFFTALFTLIDCNNDNEISKFELIGVEDSLKALKSAKENAVENPAAYVDALVAASLAVMSFFDSNSDGQLDKNDIESVFDKFLEFAKATVALVISLVKFGLNASLVPFCTAFLGLKAKTIGGEPEALTLEECNSAVKLMSQKESDSAEDDV